MKRLPWMKWYCADWRADPRLRMCSFSARGLWADMITYMHEAEPYGHFVVNGIAPDIIGMAALMGRPIEETANALSELERVQVFSRTAEGIIFSRRMLRDAEKAGKDKLNGLAGGNPTLRRGLVPKEQRLRPYKRSDAPAKTERILNRSHGRCHWCNTPLEVRMTSQGTPPPNFFQIDFVVPIRDGGTNDEDNLVAACSDCREIRQHSDTHPTLIPTPPLLPDVDFNYPQRAKFINDNNDYLSDTGYCRKDSDLKAQRPETRDQKEGGGGDAGARDPVTDWPQAELRTDPRPVEPLPDPDPHPGTARLPPMVATPEGTISQRAFDLRLKLCAAQRIDPDEPRCIGDAYQIQQWLAKGWSEEVILQAVSIAMAKRESAPTSLRYYEQAIARTLAENQRELPKVILNPNHERPHHGRNGAPRKLDGFDKIGLRIDAHFAAARGAARGGSPTGTLVERDGAKPIQLLCERKG